MTAAEAPAFGRFRAYIIPDLAGRPVRLTISGWLGEDTESMPVLEAEAEDPATTDPTDWLHSLGWELGEQGWASFRAHFQFSSGLYAADVVPGPSAVLPSVEEAAAHYLAEAAESLTRAEEQRTRAIADRRAKARRVSRLGLSSARIGEYLGISRQMADRLLRDTDEEVMAAVLREARPRGLGRE